LACCLYCTESGWRSIFHFPPTKTVRVCTSMLIKDISHFFLNSSTSSFWFNLELDFFHFLHERPFPFTKFIGSIFILFYPFLNQKESASWRRGRGGKPYGHFNVIRSFSALCGQSIQNAFSTVLLALRCITVQCAYILERWWYVGL
jgi:hypothetical protein